MVGKTLDIILGLVKMVVFMKEERWERIGAYAKQYD